MIHLSSKQAPVCFPSLYRVTPTQGGASLREWCASDDHQQGRGVRLFYSSSCVCVHTYTSYPGIRHRPSRTLLQSPAAHFTPSKDPHIRFQTHDWNSISERSIAMVALSMLLRHESGLVAPWTGQEVPGQFSKRRLCIKRTFRSQRGVGSCRAVGGTVVSPRASFALRAPPYEMDALEPYLSKSTLEFHWGKHHKAYYDNLNKQIEGTDLGGSTLEEIIKISYNNGNPLPVFNNAGQAWNHDFFWQSMRPGGGGEPAGEVLELIKRDFGTFQNFVREFKAAGATQFGSGWAWLVLKKEKLVVEKTPNAINPLIWGHIPLLTMDVWEHAYYLDYQNRRPDYITSFVDNLISWETVAARLERAKAFVNLGEPEIPKE